MPEPSAPPWLARIRRRLDRLRGSVVVVAVSGGGDSVGLLRVLHSSAAEFGLRLSVAHLDHGARGEESREDARFVEGLASGLGLPFDLGRWRATRAGHFEADARRARYDWLAGVARARGASAVAVGQTLDDQAETILHRVVRGTGIRGLAGIPASRPLAPGVTLVRPLLAIARREVRGYLAAIGQPFREDSSNRDTARTRARIRLQILPGLARENPAVALALARLGRLAGDSTRALDRLARARARAIVLEAEPDRVVLDRPRLARLGPFERAEVLRLIWREAGWPEQGMDARRWRRLAAPGGGRRSVGAGVEAEASPDRITLSRPPRPVGSPGRDPAELPVPGRVGWPGGWVVATLDPEGPRDESVDLDRLALPLSVRHPEPGDRFGPLGLEAGSQSLNDFLRGRGVPRARRGAVPIVSDAEGIVWVVGHRIAHRARLTGTTARALGLRFEADAGGPAGRRPPGLGTGFAGVGDAPSGTIPEATPMQAESLKQLYYDQLRDLYDAEKRIAAALPKMEQSASDPQLKAAFAKHLAETQGQVTRLEQVFEAGGQKAVGKTCKATQGLIAETEESIGTYTDPAVLDAALIADAQRVEHYEIAGYGTVIAYAKLLGEDRALGLLQQTLQEEKATDTSLTALAESLVNIKAA